MACELFLLSSLLLCLLSPSSSNCPLSGCTPPRSFTSSASYLGSSDAPTRPLWSYDTNKPSGGGCSTDGGRVVCPLAFGQNASLVSLAADTASSSSSSSPSHWTISLYGNVTLPLMDITGSLIATDGYDLVGYYADGTPRGDTVQLFPIQGEVLDLSIAMEEVAIILYRCGFIATYLTNGIPHAGLWLNDTVNSTKGTFIPLADPAVNNSRLYIMAAFRPHSPSPHQPLLTRLYAIEIRTDITERIEVIWHMDLPLDGYTIPYLNSGETVCIVTSAALAHGSPDLDDRHSLNVLPSRLMVQENTVVASVQLCKSPSCISMATYSSRLLRIKDLGSTYSLLSDSSLEGVVGGIAYLDVRKATADNKTTINLEDSAEGLESSRGSIVQSESNYWLLLCDTRGSLLLQEIALRDGRVIREVALNKLVGAKQMNATSEMTLVYGGQSRSCSAESEACMLILGASVFNDSSSTPWPVSEPRTTAITASPSHYILALDVSRTKDITLLWQLPLPPNEPAVGQITTVDDDQQKESIMIVTTPLAVYAYRL